MELKGNKKQMLEIIYPPLNGTTQYQSGYENPKSSEKKKNTAQFGYTK
jgi:hypothetical protein